MAHAGFHRGALGLGEAQAVQYFQRHVRADFFVAQEPDASFVAALRHRLGDVVHQHGPNERRVGVGRKLTEHEANVCEYVALGMVLRRLFTAEGGGQLRQHLGQQPALVQQVEPARGVRWAEQLKQLVADTLGAHLADGGGLLLYGGECLRLDLEPKLRREPHGAEQAQPVLTEALRRVANGTNALDLKIGLAADPVVQFAGERIVKQAVDGEVAPQGVLSRVGEAHAAGPSPVSVAALGAKGGHLVLVSGLEHHDHAELSANRDGFMEQPLNLIRLGVGGDVVVGRRLTKPGVAHAAAHPIGLKPGLGQALGQAERTSFEAVSWGVGGVGHGGSARADGPVFPENQPQSSRRGCRCRYR